MIYDFVIMGGGCAGLGAAIYAARFNLKTIVLAKRIGGLIQDTHLVENWPGIISSTGLELINQLVAHVKNYKVPIKEEEVIDIKKEGGVFSVKTNKKTYQSHTILFATGTMRKPLDVPGEKEFRNKGVSYCATCDGYLFKDKIVGVVGGSDSAAKEALLLSEYAKKVYIIYRKEKIRAEPINYDRVKKNKKIKIINNTNVVEIKGDKFIKSVIFDKPYMGKKEVLIGGLFIEIGHIVESALAKKLGVKLNEKQEIVINENSETNIPGIFAAGDCTHRPFKQAITGAAEGTIAAFSAYNYIGNKIKSEC